MDNEKATAIRDDERERRAEIAGAKVSEMKLPKEIQVPEQIFGLGKKTERVYTKTREELLKEFGPGHPQIIAVALHEYWFACWDGAAFFHLSVEDKSFNNNEHTRVLATAAGYADMHGWANALAEGLADVSPSSGRKQWIRRLTGRDILEISVVLRCMAIYWLNQASIEMIKGNTELACDLIHEANDALSINLSNAMWNDAWNDATQNVEAITRNENKGLELPDIKKEAARMLSERNRKAALVSHRENHQFKADVFEWYKENRHMFEKRSEAARAFLKTNFLPLTEGTIYLHFTGWDKLGLQTKRV